MIGPEVGSSDLSVRQARLRLRNGLSAACRLLSEGRAADARARALRSGARLFCAVAVLYLAWRAVALATGLPAGPGVGWALLVALLVAAVPALVRMYLAGGRPFPVAEAAERLDLAAGNLNRIATALDLSARAEAGPFEAAAILDGVAALGEARGVEPVLPERNPPILGTVAGIYAGVLCLVVAALLSPAAGSPGAPDEPDPVHATRLGAHPPGGPSPAESPAVQPLEARREPADIDTASPSETPPTEGRARSAPGATGNRVLATGRPGRGKSGEAREARQTSVSRGDPTEGGTPPADESRKRAGAQKKEPKKPPTGARRIGKRQPEGDPLGATVGQGGSGGGAMSPVESPWAQQDRTGDEPLPENPADEDVEDEISEDEARGGTQPSLRDRRAATSRDLSISGPGEGGEGRGGPTPPKKARGTAALVLGVPVPDFVRGLLNPGTTKVTHERVEPVTSPGNTHEPAAAATRRGPEPDVRSAGVPPALREAVRRYFKALHARAVPVPGGSSTP